MRTNHAEQNARSWYQSIADTMAYYAVATGDARDAIADEAAESALAVWVRADWHSPGDGDTTPTEYLVLLITGGPALRITGTLNHYGEALTARMEYQDWGTPWTEYRAADPYVLLQWVGFFYFGEG